MGNHDNQGSYQPSEQQWVCPGCETVNTGNNCQVCGCPRPADKQETQTLQASEGQGSYQEALSEWRCPDCETRNIGKVCTVCGRPRPESKGKRGPISKKAVIAAAAAAVIVISALVCIITVWLPYHRYQNACSLLESGQYEQAYQAFTEMGDYRSSASKSVQALCAWAESLGNAGQYEQALKLFGQLSDGSQEKERLSEECIKWAEELNDSGEYALSLKILDSLPDSSAVSLLRKDVCYNYGRSLFKKDQNYREAYLQFMAAGYYKDAAKYIEQVILAWCEDLIDYPVAEHARAFQKTVKLTAAQGRQVYNLLCSKNIYTYNSAKDGMLYACHEHDFEVRGIILEMLPASAYPNMAELKMLFSQFDENHPDVFIREHRDILEKLWDAPVVQNIVVHDFCIYDWLLGTWRTQNGSHYLKFYREEDSDVIYSSYNVPWVPEPAGTEYYYIHNLIFSWADQNNNILADVYRLKLLDPNKIEVYAYKDQKTYTMIRK